MNFSARLHPTFERLEQRRLLAGDITMVRYFDLWDGGIIPSTDVAGITYHAPSGHLYISDSEINELGGIFDGNNVFEISLAGDELFQSFVTGNDEPTGITYIEDALGVGSFYITNDDTPKHFARYDETLSGPLDTIFTTDDVPSATDPEGITSDRVTGDLYIVDGNDGGIQVLVYDASLTFQSVFSLADRMNDSEGIAFDPQSGHLFVVSGTDHLIFEYTVDGQYLEEYDISSFSTVPRAAQALTFAPTSDPNDDPNQLALYIADGGEDNFPDGRVYETLLSIPSGNRTPVLDLIDLQLVAVGEEVAFSVTAFDPNVPADTLTFSLDPGAPATATIDSATGDFRWTPGLIGNYSVTVRVTDDGSPNLTDTETFSIIVYDPSAEFGTVESRIAAGSDDAEQRATGKISLSSSDLELVYDGGDQTIGMRFNTMTIPQGATILDAYVQFQADEKGSAQTDLVLRAEDVDSATTFTSTSGSISSRSMTDAYVTWSPPAWNTTGAAGEEQRTPSLAAVVQEVVARPGWSIGNSMVIIISGTGERTAESYNGDQQGAPLLHVDYQIAGGNRTPTANPDAATVLEGGTVTVLDSGATSLLDNDTDADLPDDTLSVDLIPVTAPLYGQVTLNSDGTFSYTHNGSENFTDSFAYRVRDESEATDTAIVSVTITPVNDNSPTADDDAITVSKGGTATVLDTGATSLLTNDNDADLPNDTLLVNTTPISGPSHGTLVLNVDGTFSYTHDGSENFTDSFTYDVRDAVGNTATAVVSIVKGNRTPTANPDAATVLEGGTVTVLDSGATSLLDNDTDPDLPNETLSVDLIPLTAPLYGQVTLNSDGTFSYTH
ncbi:MAG: Ig-like domain-containing protein, partial [Thermoguttaceae bacterium]